MKYFEIFRKKNEEVRERYLLSMDRLNQIAHENTVEEPYRDYFIKTASFLLEVEKVVSLVEEDKLKSLSIEELSELQHKLYEDILIDHYEYSYANPNFAVKKLGKRFGQLLTFLYTELRGLIPSSYEYRLFHITIYLELFIEIYNYFEKMDSYTYKDVKRTIRFFMNDYCKDMVEHRTRELLDPNLSFATDIIMDWDLSDLRYLYQFGEYIDTNEIKIAEFLNHLSEEKVKAMAYTYVEGYRKGFEVAGIDLKKKKTVGIRYSIGFERMVRYAIEYFKELGLQPIIYRAAVHSVNKRQHLKIGYYSTGPNRQYDYDHRFDDGLYLNQVFRKSKLKSLQLAYEKYKEEASYYAGPAVIEIFGEDNFVPINKASAIVLNKTQQKLSIDYRRDATIIGSQFIKEDETSFTIIAYPIPEIGEQFEEIFEETVKVNTLDMNTYQEIQQKMIDVLDQGDYVRIIGKGNNKTDLKVMFVKLQDPMKETRFENCTADVNIPVGEVFTSPKLTGTSGLLHVSQVYLNGLEYKELALKFEDGKIVDYTCENFEKEEDNKRYVKENLMYNQETLPIGEFAIGTNTTAYVMAAKYNIQDKLPILIAEKTGPHFAVGDTCYKMSEELKTYNPDGKEIVAKDNEISILRKTNLELAYYNCHTDITIPYDELGEITVHNKDGSKVGIIRDGRFVLPGTEKLNEPFNE